MNQMNHLHKTVFFIMMLYGLFLAGCATTATIETTKAKRINVDSATNGSSIPKDVSAFYGTWDGTSSRDGKSVGATMKISQSVYADNAYIQITLFTFPTTDFSLMASFSAGELIAKRGGATTMIYKLHGDTLRVEYYKDGSTGEYQLTRSSRPLASQ